jgi:hypothetical protein
MTLAMKNCHNGLNTAGKHEKNIAAQIAMRETIQRCLDGLIVQTAGHSKARRHAAAPFVLNGLKVGVFLRKTGLSEYPINSHCYITIHDDQGLVQVVAAVKLSDRETGPNSFGQTNPFE